MKKIIILICCLFLVGCSTKDEPITEETIYMKAITYNELSYVEKYAKTNNLELKVSYAYNQMDEGLIVSQSIEEGTILNAGDVLMVVVSKGIIDKNGLKEDGINELGKIPIMMYHGIVNMLDNETNYTGGNVDKDGYNRTVESFRNDLEFYYANNYRMIRLEDYINYNISTEYGMSPIVLTFDDGLENNIKVTGLDEEGNIIIDPNSAVGVLEEFKEKYPDFNVTATFFVNKGLFNQPEYNDKILNWLVDNGYDIGNHTISHYDFTKIDANVSVQEVGGLYNLLDSYIPEKYVSIVSLPFGSPYSKGHDNFKYILNGVYAGNEYNTISTLRVGWEAEYSCFSNAFDSTFLKRIRAWDNNGVEFDIEMNFKLLENNRYISDGDSNTIVTSINNSSLLNEEIKKEVYLYE